MSVQEEINEMLDFLGIDEFPYDGDGYGVSFFPYTGEFTEDYDGYQISVKYKKKDNERGFALNARLSTRVDLQLGARGAISKPSRIKTPRKSVWLCLPSQEHDDDLEIEIEEEHDEEIPLLEAIHASLIVLCRNKVRENLINSQLDVLGMPWCRT